MFFHQHRKGLRSEYRDRQSQRAIDAPSRAATPRGLKTLTVLLDYRDARAAFVNRLIKYSVNVASAKSVFRFDCQNSDCIQGDFDLSKELAQAVGKKRKAVVGELLCQGWQSKAKLHTVRCHNILRYNLALAY